MINNKPKSFCCFLFFLIYVSFFPNLEAQAGKANSNLIKDYLSSISEFLQVEPTLLDPSDAETLNSLSQDLRNNLVTNPKQTSYSRVKVQEKDDQGRRKMNLLNIAYSDLSTIKEIEEAHKDIKNHLKEHRDGSSKINEGNVLERSVKVLNHFERILAKVKKTGFNSILGNEQNFKALNNIKERMRGNLAIIKEGQGYIDKIGKESLDNVKIPIMKVKAKPILKNARSMLKVKAMDKHLMRIDSFLQYHWKKVVEFSKLNLQHIEELKKDSPKAELKTYRTLAPWEKVLSDATQESKNPKLFDRPHRADAYKDGGITSFCLLPNKELWTRKQIGTAFCFGEKDMERQREAGRDFKRFFKQRHEIKSSSFVINTYDVLDKFPLPSAVTGVMLRLGHLDKK